MRILLANRVRPILLIAFTNHALDHLLISVLDKAITKKIVRLGSRSNDERISNFSMESLERLDSSTNRSAINKAYRAIKNSENELKKVLDQLQGGEVPASEREEYMTLFFPSHLDELKHPPSWIQAIRESEVGWTTAGGKETAEMRPEYDFWLSCADIDWVVAQNQVKEQKAEALANRFASLDIEEAESQSSDGMELIDEEEFEDFEPMDELEDEETEEAGLRQFLAATGLAELPAIPDTDRPLEELQADDMVWGMSMTERERLAFFWTEATRQEFFDRKRDSFAYLKEKYENAREAYEECQAQVSSAFIA